MIGICSHIQVDLSRAFIVNVDNLIGVNYLMVYSQAQLRVE